mmetsp:Transcript_7691/g.11044  ORF Transcript_7691/g.11044 Transcript_7691/m.11044 type:complete len:262 (-) Transcript_7691:55-840(-)
MMRASLSLAVLGLIGSFAYGFSSSTAPRLPSAISRTPFTTTPSQTPKSNIFTLPSKVAQISSFRGGAMSPKSTTAGDSSEASSALNLRTILASLWGTSGVAYILLKAVRRVVPIALEPFAGDTGGIPLSQFQLIAYVGTCVWFAYVEGYKGFQTKFSPLVVSRSLTLGRPGTPIHHLLFGPFYSMGLFHATKKRMTVSWGVTLGVAGIVAAVKRLPYPWRNIVDAGVVVGLTWGTLAMLASYVKALFNGGSEFDPALPSEN